MVITQKNCQRKNLLGNEQWRAVNSIEILSGSEQNGSKIWTVPFHEAK